MRADWTRASGVTLLEMLISTSLVVIVGAIAVPGFNNLRQDTERATAVNGFVHALYLARSEAIKRGTVVSICKSVDGQTCSNNLPDWNAGWMVFANEDRDDLPVRDTDETVLHVYQGWAAGHITSNRAAYSFRPLTQSVVNGTLVFCDSRGADYARAIIINHAGRPRISQRDASSHTLRCPP